MYNVDDDVGTVQSHVVLVGRCNEIEGTHDNT